LGADVQSTILPDGVEPLLGQLHALAQAGVELIVCTGGTGLGPRDETPEALRALGGRDVPGLAELCRSEGRHHTALSWLSRMTAVQFGNCLIIALPGSPRAVSQNFAILAPLLAHALAMIAGKDHA
jgi:molybdenum cofactor synthesis domain-containing protein